MHSKNFLWDLNKILSKIFQGFDAVQRPINFFNKPGESIDDLCAVVNTMDFFFGRARHGLSPVCVLYRRIFLLPAVNRSALLLVKPSL